MGITEERKLLKEKMRLEREELARKYAEELEALKDEYGEFPRDISRLSKSAKTNIAPMIRKYGVEHCIEQVREFGEELLGTPSKKGGRGKKGA